MVRMILEWEGKGGNLIGIADAIIKFFLDDAHSLTEARAGRNDLEEVIDYLNVFREHHPAESYGREVDD